VRVRVRGRDGDRDRVYRDVVVDHVDAPVEDEAVDVRAQRRLGCGGDEQCSAHTAKWHVRPAICLLRIGVGRARRSRIGPSRPAKRRRAW